MTTAYAQKAQADATAAIAAAAAAQTTANTGVTNAATAQTTANTGVTNAATAQTTANTGVTNAAAAQTAANAALAAAAASWVTLTDTDLSAQANQTLNANTTYTINGLVWTKKNSAGDATAMAIVNGTGLRITPVAATDWFGATQTAPVIYLPLTNIPNVSWTTRLRVTMAVAASNITANYDNAFCGLINSLGNNVQQLVLRGRSASGAGIWARDTVNTDANTDVVVALGAANTVIRATFDMVNLRQAVMATSIANFNTRNLDNYVMTRDLKSLGTYVGVPATVASMAIAIGALRAASATALVVDISRIKIEYQL